MALQIWLPLNKDLRNIGLNGNNITNYSTTFSASGPTNGSIYFENSKYIDLNYDMSSKQEFTIAMYVYCTGTTFAGNLFTVEKSTYWQFIVYSGTLQWRDDVIGYSGTRKSITLPTVTANSWNHLCITFNNGTVTVYLNGTKRNEVSGDGTKLNSGISHFWVGHCGDGYWFTGYISNLMVYDNVLTEDDIKNLCKINVFDLVPYKDGIRGGILFDRSGYCLSAVTPYNLSYKNSCVVLNGTNSSIQIPPMTQINSGGIFTMNVWFLKSSFGSKGWETIFGGPGGFELETKRSSAKNPVIVPYNWGGGSSVTTYDMPYNLNKWVMVSMVRNASNCKFFINGELKYTGSRGSIPSGNYFIGSWSTTSSQNFKGNVSNFKLYRKDLTDEEIAELYEKEKEMFLPDDYEELEYVESHGTEYIDTNVNFMYGDEFYFEYMQIQSASSENKGYGAGDVLANNITGGGRKYTSTSNVELYVTQSNLTFSPSIPYTSSLNKKYVEHWIIKNNVISVTLTDLQTNQKSTAQKSNIKSTYNSGNSVYLWRDHSTQYAYYSKARIYRVWLKRENGVYAFHLVPVKRRNDGEIGMFDLVTREFLTNQGTGDFTGA